MRADVFRVVITALTLIAEADTRMLVQANGTQELTIQT